MRAQLVDRHVTPRAVYGAVYSPDGERLVCGGGFWYGDGFITCFAGGRETSWACRDADADGADWSELAISGLCFDAEGKHLAVSAWASRHRYHPALLYRIDGDLLSLLAVHHDRADQRERVRAAHGDAMATGVLLHEGWLVVRRTAPFHELTFSAFRVPPDVTTASGAQHHSARLVGLPGAVASGFLPSPLRRHGGLVVDHGGFDDLAEPPGARIGDEGALVVARIGDAGVMSCSAWPNPHARDPATARDAWQRLPLDDESDASRVTLGVREPPLGTVTAIACDGARIFTCGSDGSVATWTHAGERTGLRQAHPMPIAAACVVPSSGLLVTADRAGLLRAWDGDTLAGEWSMPGTSPRTLAAHPTLPRLAVGGKAPSGGPAPGGLAQYDLQR